MKRILYLAFLLSFLVFLLRYPALSLQTAKTGLELWLNTLLPTLLPFLILTDLIVQTGNIDRLFAPFSGFWRILFGLSPTGAYVLALGLLCGYPMGARLTGTLYDQGQLSRREALYLLTFCNNPSPAFLLSYLCVSCLENAWPASQVLGILLLSNLLCMLTFRFLVFPCIDRYSLLHQASRPILHQTSRHVLPQIPRPVFDSQKKTPAKSSFGAIMDVSIMNGFETITRLGGYILFFSFVAAIIRHTTAFLPEALRQILLCSAELTTGLAGLHTSTLPPAMKYLYAMTATSFGGICIMAQTRSVLSKELPLSSYICAKCLNAMYTLILICVFSPVFRY